MEGIRLSYLFVVKGRKPAKFDVNTCGADGQVQRGPSKDLSWRQLQELLVGLGVGAAWIPLTVEEINTELPATQNKHTRNLVMAFRSAQ